MSSRLTCASSNTSPVSVLAVSTSYDRYVVFGRLLGARELASLTVTAFAGHLKLCSYPVPRGAVAKLSTSNELEASNQLEAFAPRVRHVASSHAEINLVSAASLHFA